MSNSYRFGQFVLDPGRRTLSLAGSTVSLTPKAFDVLLFLAQNPNRLVTKEELLQAVWGDTFVEEGNLTQYVWQLRRALEDNSEDSRLIVTIARKGWESHRCRGGGHRQASLGPSPDRRKFARQYAIPYRGS